eukprot:789750_1
MFADSQEYQACLNGAYKGMEAGLCSAASDSSFTSQSVANSIKNTRIVVNGGDTTQFTTIFNSFEDKTNEFQEWIDELVDLAYIIGGNVNEIHDVIQATITLGNHQLNQHLSTPVDDDTSLSIASALESAYDDYALALSDNDIAFEDG